MNPTPPDNPLAVSYLTLRTVVGVLGISLPIVVAIVPAWLLGVPFQGSISAYYYTDMRNVFVGTLFVIGYFLLTYKGHERSDEIAGTLVWLFATGTALFPTAPDGNSCKLERIYCVHPGFASALFLTLAFFSLFLFTKTKPGQILSKEKQRRIKIYKVCGYIMFGSIVVVPATYYFSDAERQALHPVLWLEAISVWAFGVSWLVKGTDAPSQP